MFKHGNFMNFLATTSLLCCSLFMNQSYLRKSPQHPEVHWLTGNVPDNALRSFK